MVSWDIQHWTLEEWFPNNWDNSHTAQARTNTWNIENPKYRNVPDPVSVSPCRRVSRDRHRNAVCRILDLCCSHLTSLYAKLFLPVADRIGTEEEEGGMANFTSIFCWMSDYPSPNFPIYMSPDILHNVAGFWRLRLWINDECDQCVQRTKGQGAVQGPSVNHAIGGQP